MTKGLVFGKFLPFHKGHQALIEFGASQCDELIVIICCSSQERIAGTIRSEWISETFKDRPRIHPIVFEYDESVLPNTSESSWEVSKVWADEFMRLVPDTHVLFTSEPYGGYVAEFMGIEHVPFDEGREEFSISGTKLRESLYEHWDFLPDSVKRHFQKKVVLLGTESVGKSTLAVYLSSQFRSCMVHELGRDIISDSQHFTIDQLRRIAEGHAGQIQKAAAGLEPLVVIDTDIHITQSYAMHTFGEYLEVPDWIYHQNRADLYLYLNADVPFVQDGTRLDFPARNALDVSHRRTLDQFGVAFEELTGTYEERNERAGELVKALVNRFA